MGGAQASGTGRGQARGRGQPLHAMAPRAMLDIVRLGQFLIANSGQPMCHSFGTRITLGRKPRRNDGERRNQSCQSQLAHHVLRQAAPIIIAVEQWYSMLLVPKHQITLLLSCGR